ncbi:hypothetical protein E3Q22_02866 [Wallemia mellicola]|nr:hypothetical protein E3Q24_02472 [Wallemia mellicola]TIB74956.1 hypothetical protein E3Q23_02498 [Wallemia mellicola]TIB77805.1 hypothetical protein E3Q22_02866 [Wallemia mellicola]TIB86490.1 hypothetical protein E3Q21_01649 [Wallemia mellicola]TIB89358.1 hypothetical protein E3Q20_01639 [Wallemia mellicola]
MLAAQTAHAATAVIQETHSDPLTQEYVSPDNLDKMRKTVLQTPDGESLVRLYQDILPLGKAKLWIEQPENIPTAIAIAPNKSKKIKDLLRHNGCVFF